MLPALAVFNPVFALFGFVFLCIAIAVVIILVKWLLGLSGIAIPQPLLYVFGLIVFAVMLYFFLVWVGLYPR